jgi:drug/metabolite transporter (DMT)-like permease
MEMKTVLMIAIVILAGSAGDILVSRGMKQVGAVETLRLRALLAIARRAITTPAIIGGIASMAVAFFSLLAVLSWAPISLVSPATALGYVLNTFGAKFYLKEKIDKERWIGTLLVCIGAAFLSV